MTAALKRILSMRTLRCFSNGKEVRLLELTETRAVRALRWSGEELPEDGTLPPAERKYFEQNGWRFVLLKDADNLVADHYPVFLDEEGKLRIGPGRLRFKMIPHSPSSIFEICDRYACFAMSEEPSIDGYYTVATGKGDVLVALFNLEKDEEIELVEPELLPAEAEVPFTVADAG